MFQITRLHLLQWPVSLATGRTWITITRQRLKSISTAVHSTKQLAKLYLVEQRSIMALGLEEAPSITTVGHSK